MQGGTVIDVYFTRAAFLGTLEGDPTACQALFTPKVQAN